MVMRKQKIKSRPSLSDELEWVAFHMPTRNQFVCIYKYKFFPDRHIEYGISPRLKHVWSVPLAYVDCNKYGIPYRCRIHGASNATMEELAIINRYDALWRKIGKEDNGDDFGLGG